MSIAIASTPLKSAGASSQCTWNSAHQPIVFTIQRRDFNISSFISPSAGVLRITIGSTSELTAGTSKVFIQINSTVNGDNYYDAIYTVLNVHSATQFDISFGYYSDIASMAYVNIYSDRRNYYVVTTIWNDTITTVLGESRNKPNVAGLVTVNVESFVKPLVGFDNTFTYGAHNFLDSTLGGSCYISCVEWYNSSDQDTIDADASTRFYYANAVKQMQELYGSNLLDFFPNKDQPLSAKFMCDFKTPTMFAGLPFDLTYIHSTVKSDKEEIYDVNNNFLAATNTNFTGFYVCRLMQALTAHPSFPVAATIQQKLYDGSSNLLTETKVIKVNHTCQQNPVYVCWLGKRGGRNYWCFNKTQTKAKTVANVNTFVPNINNIETTKGYGEIFSKDSTPQLIVGTTALIEDIGDVVFRDSGISTMLDSVCVFVLLNPTTWQTDGARTSPYPKWMRVQIQPGSFKLYETENRYATIELIFDLPQLYNQKQ